MGLNWVKGTTFTKMKPLCELEKHHGAQLGQGYNIYKMKPLCELEKHRGAQLGQGYKNDRACSMFIEYIARDQQERLVATLSKAHF